MVCVSRIQSDLYISRWYDAHTENLCLHSVHPQCGADTMPRPGPSALLFRGGDNIASQLIERIRHPDECKLTSGRQISGVLFESGQFSDVDTWTPQGLWINPKCMELCLKC